MSCWHNQELRVLEDMSVECLLCGEIIGKARKGQDGTIYFSDGILVPPEVREEMAEEDGQEDL